MSALRRPRANFRGVFTTNVPTANNDKVSYTLDEPNNEVVNPSQMPDADYRKWMMQTKQVGLTPPVPWLNSYFNYFGDSGTTFKADASAGMPYTDTTIVSSVLQDGKTYKKGQDIFITGRVELLGDLFFDKPGAAKMVDLDPIGIYGTQIFSGEFRVVVTTPAGPVVMLSGKNPNRAYIRDMYVDRNIMPNVPPGAWICGAIWQLGLPLESLTINIDPSSPANQSPTLFALAKAAKAGQGLLVRFATYYTLDGIAEGDLAEKFKNSGYKDAILNPATGMLVGSIGAWDQGELASMPVSRLLYPAMPITRPTSKYVFNVSAREKSQPIHIKAAATPMPPPPPYYLAPAAVIVDTQQQTVILDLLTTIPEDTNVSQPPSPTKDLHKKNYGNLKFTILSNGKEQTVATIPYEQYNRVAYELNSGIIEIPYAPGLASALTDPNGIFRLYGDKLGSLPAMQEIGCGFVITDDQCLYLHEGETSTYNIQVFYKGQPLRNQVLSITTSEYHFVSGPDAPNQLAPKTFEPLDNTPGKEFVVTIPPQQKLPADQTALTPVVSLIAGGNAPTTYYKTDGNGMITLTVKGIHRGAVMLRYQLAGDNFDPNIGGSNRYLYFGFAFFNTFRVLPNDNYDHIPDNQITWDFVYKEVIQYFYLLYPGMFARLAFQNETIARQSASLIRQMVDKRTWDSTSYMPVSRDLSDGKRKLLQRWCALNE